jgi:hypothetical protein
MKRTGNAPRRASGPKTLEGTPEAKRQAAVVLEVLSGLRGPSEGSEAMGVSLNRYYQLETRALQGLIAALEPRPKGRQRRPEDEIGKLRHDNERLTRELARAQALVRAAQRSIGLPAVPKPTKGRRMKGTVETKGKRVRRRRRVVRATKAIAALRQPAPPAPATKPETVRGETKPSPAAAS